MGYLMWFNLPAINWLAGILISGHNGAEQYQHGYGVAMMQTIDEEVIIAQRTPFRHRQIS